LDEEKSKCACLAQEIVLTLQYYERAKFVVAGESPSAQK
jgi:hypothetical protein